MSHEMREPEDYHLASPRGRTYRPNFVLHMTNAASEFNAKLGWLSNNYIAVLRSAHTTRLIVGYHFPLNSAAASMAADDKVAAAEILAHFDIPHLRQALIRFKSAKGLDREVRRVVNHFPFPLVVKPYRGTGGRDVTRVDSEEDLVATCTSLRTRHQALAVSCWLDIKHEYRVIVLYNQVELIFEKTKTALPGRGQRTSQGGPEWRHNLKYGSVPVVQAARETCAQLSKIAVCAMNALGLNFASVDIAETSDGYAVLEINSGVCLERFGTFSAEHFRRAGLVYSHAVGACIGQPAGDNTLSNRYARYPGSAAIDYIHNNYSQ